MTAPFPPFPTLSPDLRAYLGLPEKPVKELPDMSPFTEDFTEDDLSALLIKSEQTALELEPLISACTTGSGCRKTQALALLDLSEGLLRDLKQLEGWLNRVDGDLQMAYDHITEVTDAYRAKKAGNVKEAPTTVVDGRGSVFPPLLMLVGLVVAFVYVMKRLRGRR